MHVMLIAQQAVSRSERLRGMHERFSHVAPDTTRNILLIMIMFCGVLGIIWMLNRWQRNRQQQRELSPMKLFFRVMRKARLSWLDRVRLWHVARCACVAHPASMLISASVFDQAVRKYIRARSRLRRNLAAEQRLRQLREQLFEEPVAEAGNVPV